MTINKYICAENKNKRNKYLSHIFNYRIASIIYYIIRLISRLFFLVIHKDYNRASCCEKHKGFAESVKRTVIKYHSRNRIDSARFISALLNIMLVHLVHCRYISLCKRGHKIHFCRKYSDKYYAENYRKHLVFLKRKLYLLLFKRVDYFRFLRLLLFRKAFR